MLQRLKFVSCILLGIVLYSVGVYLSGFDFILKRGPDAVFIYVMGVLTVAFFGWIGYGWAYVFAPDIGK